MSVETYLLKAKPTVVRAVGPIQIGAQTYQDGAVLPMNAFAFSQVILSSSLFGPPGSDVLRWLMHASKQMATLSQAYKAGDILDPSIFRLGYGASRTTQQQPSAGLAGTHRVREGERLSDIAALHGVPYEEIVAANPHKELMLLGSGETVFAQLAEGEHIALGAPPSFKDPSKVPGKGGGKAVPRVKMKPMFQVLLNGRLGTNFGGVLPQYVRGNGVEDAVGWYGNGSGIESNTVLSTTAINTGLPVTKIWEIKSSAKGPRVIWTAGFASLLQATPTATGLPGVPVNDLGVLPSGFDLTPYVVLSGVASSQPFVPSLAGDPYADEPVAR